MAMAHSPDGTRLATGTKDGRAQVWDLAGTPKRHGSPLSVRGAITAVAFAPDGKIVAVGGDAGMVKTWEVDHPTAQKSWETGLPAQRIGFFRRSLWLQTRSNKVLFLDPSTGPRATLALTPEGAIIHTADSHYSGYGDTQLGVHAYRGAERLSEYDTRQRFNREEVATSVTGERSWWASFWRFAVVAVAKFRSLPRETQVAVGITTAYALVVITLIGVWLFRPAALANWSMFISQEPGVTDLKTLVKVLFLVRLFGNSQRALDAWLKQQQAALTWKCFNEKNVVKARVPCADIWPGHNMLFWEPAIKGGSARSWVSGPGGVGKSTLAARSSARSPCRSWRGRQRGRRR
jgi:hypothetical protein